MIKIEDFEKLGLDVTWTLIDIGFRGNKIFGNELSPNDVIDYAVRELEKNTSPQIMLISELAGENAKNLDNIDDYLKMLLHEENIDSVKEFEKWRVCFVNKHLIAKKENFIDGLTELGDIWLRIGLSNGDPHFFQGIGNNLSPTEYYTKQNYDSIFEAHLSWVSKKVAELKFL